VFKVDFAMAKVFPNRDALLEIANRLKCAGIHFALGGSGLMTFYGCETDIHDWDITTDASEGVVKQALEGLIFDEVHPNGIFATKRLYKVSLKGSYIDVMCGFSLKTSNGVYEVPTVITAEWDGIPMGDPNVWIKVYRLMGRHAKADQLHAAVSS
jgi:hypothetical protein